MTAPAPAEPTVLTDLDADLSAVPRLGLVDAADYEPSLAEVRGAALGLAYRFRPEYVDALPAEIEVSVVTAGAVEVYGYRLTPGQVELTDEPLADPRIRLTLQKAVDFLLMENGVSLITVVASGRASLTGDQADILTAFGTADYAPLPGRRSFRDLADLLMRARDARPRELPKLVDAFGRADFARELVHFFTDAAQLSGVPRDLEPATIKFGFGGIDFLTRIDPAGSTVAPVGPGATWEATIDVPKIETMVDRLLGRVGDMDAILSRRMLVAGPAVDDLMPLFERISTGLTVFTAVEEVREWTFPTTSR